MLAQAALLILALYRPVWAADEKDDVEPGFNAPTFEGLALRNIGPAFAAGRIADIAVDPTDRSRWFVAVGSGGVWRTENRGTTWTPIFDKEDTYSIGCVTLDPNDPDTIWVGTGENVSGRHVGYGSGVYVSYDGGENWENKGLGDSEHIGMIVVDPRDSKTLFVAAQGPLWSPGGDRGLFKSTDGGASWKKILGNGLGNTIQDDQYTGVSEVHLSPSDPNVMWAVSWQRFRNTAALMDGGPGTGIHKSEDGGKTWRKLTEGLPKETMGKTGLSVSPVDPDVVYATIELAKRTGGFWRSTDGGETWEKRSDYVSGGTGPHYYNELFASPHSVDHVYQMDVHLHVTEDGGASFQRLQHDSKHTDHHALVFDPTNPDYLLTGTDGGLYESFDRGTTWRFFPNLPITQYYKVAVDNDEPFYNVYGGTQDNNSHGGPSRTMSNNGIRNADWFVTLFGDGHQPAVDPSNPDIVYSQWQQGNLTRYDRRTGESVYIRPQPTDPKVAERFNWDAPILISPHDPKTVFFGSQRLWRSDDYGDTWTDLSGDLTRSENRLTQPLMGRTWSVDAPWDLYAMSRYNTVTAIAQSPLDADLIYVGTDDGLLQITEDGGQRWRTVGRLPRVPRGFYVNDIKADLHDPDTVYVVLDLHKQGDFTPYLLKSTNRGRSWRDIRGNLPDRHVLWRLVQDHVEPDLLFLGTEFGVFFTVDRGRRWTQLKGGTPTIPFRDLAIQRRENDLVGATFGRGFYILDDYSPLREVTTDLLDSKAALFSVRETPWYVPKRTMGCSRPECVASRGDGYYRAPNPPFGATFTYYLPQGLQTKQEARRKGEREKEKANRDVTFPSWSDIRAEELQAAPAIVLTVTDDQGSVIREIEGPVEAGFHRVTWDLRFSPVDAWEPTDESGSNWEPLGVLVQPGTYRVAMAQRVDGVVTSIGKTQTFDVVSVRAEPVIEGADQTQRIAFEQEAEEVRRAAESAESRIGEVVAELDAILEILARFSESGALDNTATTLKRGLELQRDRLTGHETRSVFGDTVTTVGGWLWHARFTANSNVYGPTGAQRTSLAQAQELLADVLDQLGTYEAEYQRLKGALDDAKAPWTPGRAIRTQP
ncbi:MAG: glycosyl hydrolase [Myxococcota bacterium]